MLRDAFDRHEGRRRRLARGTDRPLERTLDGGCRQGRAVGELDAAPQFQPNRPAAFLEGPSLAQERHEIALGVRRDEGLVDIPEDLVFFGRLISARIRRQDRIRHGRHEPASRGDLLFSLHLRRGPPLDLGQVLRGLRVFAAQVGDGRAEREELAALVQSFLRGRGVQAALDPPAGLFRAALLPRGLRREEHDRDGFLEGLFFLEDLDRRVGFPQGSLGVAGHTVRARHEQPRFPLQDRISGPLFVFQEFQARLCRPQRLVGGEGVQGLLGELQPVFHGLLRDVGLRKMVHEVGIDALQPPRVAFLQQLGILTVE